MAFLVLGLDRATKYWVRHDSGLPLGSYWPHGGIEIVPGFFYLAHIGNRGAAWGLFGGFGTGLIILAVLALGAIFYFREDLGLKRKSMQIVFGLLCGGIIGNLADRLLFGYVVDFLDFHLPGYRWPAFNIADSGISIGVFGYILGTLLFAENQK